MCDMIDLCCSQVLEGEQVVHKSRLQVSFIFPSFFITKLCLIRVHVKGQPHLSGVEKPAARSYAQQQPFTDVIKMSLAIMKENTLYSNQFVQEAVLQCVQRLSEGQQDMRVGLITFSYQVQLTSLLYKKKKPCSSHTYNHSPIVPPPLFLSPNLRLTHILP